VDGRVTIGHKCRPDPVILSGSGEREDPLQSFRHSRQILATGLLLLAASFAVFGEEIAKSIFLVMEDKRVTAVNAETGQFFDLDVDAKEVVEQHIVAKGVAIIVTNQRFAGIGQWPSGWASRRRSAGEQVISTEAEDTAAVIVTNDRVLSFNGRTGAWAEKRR